MSAKRKDEQLEELVARNISLAFLLETIQNDCHELQDDDYLDGLLWEHELYEPLSVEEIVLLVNFFRKQPVESLRTRDLKDMLREAGYLSVTAVQL